MFYISLVIVSWLRYRGFRSQWYYLIVKYLITLEWEDYKTVPSWVRRFSYQIFEEHSSNDGRFSYVLMARYSNLKIGKNSSFIGVNIILIRQTAISVICEILFCNCVLEIESYVFEKWASQSTKYTWNLNKWCRQMASHNNKLHVCDSVTVWFGCINSEDVLFI